MKKLLRNWAETIITLVLTVALVHCLGYLVRPVSSDQSIAAMKAFRCIPENSVEVLCYGSSHMWRGLDVMAMYKKYGIGAYNYACNWQHINTTSLFVEDSLRVQSPRVAIVDTFRVNELLQDTDVNGEIYYTRILPHSSAKDAYLQQCFGPSGMRYLSYYMPLCAFHDNWVNLGKESFIPRFHKEEFLNSMGYRFTSGSIPVKIMRCPSGEQQEISDEALTVLEHIQKLCSENGVQLLLVTLPWEEEFAYGDALNRWSQQHGCAYLNLFDHLDELGLDTTTDFYDPSHLNGTGAAKIADFLGRYLINHYDLTDMRTIPRNLWEQARAS